MPVKVNKEGRYEVQGSERGERFHRVLPKGAKREDAKRLEAKLRRDIFKVRELGDTPEVSLTNAVLEYFDQYLGKAKDKAKSHGKALGPHIQGRMLTDIVSVAATIRNTPKLTNSTKNRRLAILRRVAHLAYRRWGWLKEPLHEKIELLPENPARDVYLSRGELAALIRALPHREMRRAVLILAFTGMRRGELFGLKPNDIRGDVICLSDTKTGKPRNIPILPAIRFAFRRRLTVHPDSLSHAVERVSGGKVRVHDLRHSCASLLIQAGVPLFTVGAILGHSSTQTTKRYAHLDHKSMEVAISKLQPTRQLPAKNESSDKAA